MKQDLKCPEPVNFRLNGIYQDVERYYAAKLRRFGPTPLGVDWSCAPTQALRFRQLLKLCDFSSPFSLNDLGCGYGALVGYFGAYHSQARIDYLGIDISPAMIRKAKKLWHGSLIQFHHGYRSPRAADYSLASGIFNVMLQHSIADWEQFIENTLSHLNETSRYGFAINFVARPQVGQRSRPGLYCTSPSRWASYCEHALRSRVTLIERYGMSEFTLLVRSERSES